MKYSLGQASQATGKAKSTILRAVKKGVLSASKGPQGAYEIDPAELNRVYGRETAQPRNACQSNETQPSFEHPERLKLRLELAEKERERERDQMQATIDDLRARLDRSEDRITALLADQRVPKPRRRWWQRRK